jgi:hypothetical protein
MFLGLSREHRLSSTEMDEVLAKDNHRARTHLSLDKDAPHRRAIERPELGKVISIREVGGLHHRYVRRAA